MRESETETERVRENVRVRARVRVLRVVGYAWMGCMWRCRTYGAGARADRPKLTTSNAVAARVSSPPARAANATPASAVDVLITSRRLEATSRHPITRPAAYSPQSSSNSEVPINPAVSVMDWYTAAAASHAACSTWEIDSHARGREGVQRPRKKQRGSQRD